MSSQSDLNKLQKLWYSKLKADGFEDIEQENGMLKEWSSKFYTSQFKETNGTKAEDKIPINYAKAEYYRLAEHFLNSHKFKNRLESLIWNLHSQGMSFREIAKKLKNSTNSLRLNKDNINTVIKTLAKTMMSQIKRDNDDNN